MQEKTKKSLCDMFPNLSQLFWDFYGIGQIVNVTNISGKSEIFGKTIFLSQEIKHGHVPSRRLMFIFMFKFTLRFMTLVFWYRSINSGSILLTKILAKLVT